MSLLGRILLVTLLTLLVLSLAVFPQWSIDTRQALLKLEVRPTFPLTFFGTEWWALPPRDVFEIYSAWRVWGIVSVILGSVLIFCGLVFMAGEGLWHEQDKSEVIYAVRIIILGVMVLCFFPQALMAGVIFVLTCFFWGLLRALWYLFQKNN